MSFSKFKLGELRQIAEGFGVDVPAKTSKENIVLLLEEEGITYAMYEKFAGAESEDLEEENLPVNQPPVQQERTLLVRMERPNMSFQTGRYVFTQQHPFVVMTESDAQRLFDTERGFRLANPREAQEFYS